MSDVVRSFSQCLPTIVCVFLYLMFFCRFAFVENVIDSQNKKGKIRKNTTIDIIEQAGKPLLSFDGLWI